MGHQATESPLIGNNVDVFDKVRRRGSAVSMDAAELARLDGVNDGLQIRQTDTVDTLGIDDGAVGKNLEEHAELTAVIGASECQSGQDRIRGRDSGADRVTWA